MRPGRLMGPGMSGFFAVEAPPFYLSLRLAYTASGTRTRTDSEGWEVTETIDFSIENTWTRVPIGGGYLFPADPEDPFELAADRCLILMAQPLTRGADFRRPKVRFKLGANSAEAEIVLGVRTRVWAGPPEVIEETDILGTPWLEAPEFFSSEGSAVRRPEIDRWGYSDSVSEVGGPIAVDVSAWAFDAFRDLRATRSASVTEAADETWDTNSVEHVFEWEIGGA